MPSSHLSRAFAQAAARQRKIERREAVAAWLRRLADQVAPDRTYKPVMARIRWDEQLRPIATMTVRSERDDPEAWNALETPAGFRVYLRRVTTEDIIANQIRLTEQENPA